MQANIADAIFLFLFYEVNFAIQAATKHVEKTPAEHRRDKTNEQTRTKSFYLWFSGLKCSHGCFCCSFETGLRRSTSHQALTQYLDFLEV